MSSGLKSPLFVFKLYSKRVFYRRSTGHIDIIDKAFLGKVFEGL